MAGEGGGQGNEDRSFDPSGDSANHADHEMDDSVSASFEAGSAKVGL